MTQDNPKDPQAELFKAIEEILLGKYAPTDEYDHDMIDPMWEQNYPKVAKQLLKLFQAREQKLLTELLGELPEKRGWDNVRGMHPACGLLIENCGCQEFDEAIDQVVSVIERYREEL